MIRTGAFLRRDFRVARSYRAAFAGQIIGLLLFVATFGLVAPIVRDDFASTYGSGYFAFVAVGVAVTGALLGALQAFASALREAQLEGTLEAVLLAPAPHEQLIAMMGVWPLVAAFIGSAITLGVAAVAGVGFHVNLASLALVVPISVLAFAGLGLLSAAGVLVVKRGDPVSTVLGLTGALTAGAYAPVSTFPSWLRAVAACNPMTYALDAWRGALLQAKAPNELIGPLVVLALMSIVALPVARWGLRRALVLARAEGTLASY